MRTNSALSSASLLFSTILYQMAFSVDHLYPRIILAVKSFLRRGNSCESLAVEASTRLLREALAGIKKDVRPVVIVLDGLDECSDRRRLVEQINVR